MSEIDTARLEAIVKDNYWPKNELGLELWNIDAPITRREVVKMAESLLTLAARSPAPTDVGDDLDLLTARLKSADAGATNAPVGYVEDMHEAATALTTLRERVARLEEALRRVVAAYDDCSGYEPSVSVLHREIDTRARTAIGE